MVTAETAMALPALLLVLGFALTVQSVVATKAACADAARAGARVAARGDADRVVVAAVRAAYPRADDVRVVRQGGLIHVEVVARPSLLAPRVVVPLVTGHAAAADEAAS